MIASSNPLWGHEYCGHRRGGRKKAEPSMSVHEKRGRVFVQSGFFVSSLSSLPTQARPEWKWEHLFPYLTWYFIYTVVYHHFGRPRSIGAKLVGGGNRPPSCVSPLADGTLWSQRPKKPDNSLPGGLISEFTDASLRPDVMG